MLLEALQAALGRMDAATVSRELERFAAADARALLAGAGIRDEYVFPTPSLLTAEPRLLGYYRLLLGRPQKSFYGGDGYGMFKGMEISGRINPRQMAQLADFCSAIGEGMGELIRQMAPTITMQDVTELPLLILGSQFQGLSNNVIGANAIREVFLAVQELVEDSIVPPRTDRSIIVENATGRRVRITVAADPDIQIQEEFEGGALHNKVALEIKGGTDASNAHNRAGEAEKSHQTAKSHGFDVCWTLIALRGVDSTRLRTESPTTQHWFDIAEVLAREGPYWDDFRRRLAGAVGIAL